MSHVRRGLKPLRRKWNVEFGVIRNVLGEECCQCHHVKSREAHHLNVEDGA